MCARIGEYIHIPVVESIWRDIDPLVVEEAKARDELAHDNGVERAGTWHEQLQRNRRLLHSLFRNGSLSKYFARPIYISLLSTVLFSHYLKSDHIICRIIHVAFRQSQIEKVSGQRAILVICFLYATKLFQTTTNKLLLQ